MSRDIRREIATRVATHLSDGQYVNLGIGVPTVVADVLAPDSGIVLHSENGILGMRGLHDDELVDMELVDAGKRPVGMLPGGAIFDQSLSFAMIRGGHVDVAVLGAFEVATNGDLASWSLGVGQANGVGGAMDLAAGAKKVFVTTTHLNKQGRSKLVRECTLPLTARRAVDLVFTELGTFEPRGNVFHVVDLAPGVTPVDLIGGDGDEDLYVFSEMETTTCGGNSDGAHV